MKKAHLIICLSIAGLFLTSCFQHSAVVRIKKDGSGEIFERNHFSPQMTGMMGGMGAELGGEEGADMTKPDADELKKGASKYGEGVTYTSHKEDKNKDGWEGYVVVYGFKDVSKIKLTGDSAMPGDMKEMAEEQGQAMEDTGEVTFKMNDGVLTINNTMNSVDSLKDQMGGDSEEMPEGVKPSQMMGMMAGMFKGMRMGMFVRIDGGIAETDASHVAGDFITLSDVDMGKMLGDAKFLAFVDKAAADPDSITEEEAEKITKEIEGVKAEMKEKVMVKFK